MKKSLCHALLLITAIAVPAHAEIIAGTADPFENPYGMNGFDVMDLQSVASRFNVTENVNVNKISLWLMNNTDTPGTELTVSLREDEVNQQGESRPSEKILASWTINLNTSGWNPYMHAIEIPSSSNIHLKKKTSYWIVAESNASIKNNPVWLIAHPGEGIYSNKVNQSEWGPGGLSAVPSYIISGEAEK